MVDSLTWLGCLLNRADTEALDNTRPARSISRLRSSVAVHTPRWAAAIRSLHLIRIRILLGWPAFLLLHNSDIGSGISDPADSLPQAFSKPSSARSQLELKRFFSQQGAT
jgi:hypothetical protein